MTIIPAPGTYVVKPLESTSTLISTEKPHGKILRGIVLSVGEPSVTKFGAKVSPTAKEGDQILFLSYNEVGGYDEIKLGATTYNIVEFLDYRGTINEN